LAFGFNATSLLRPLIGIRKTRIIARVTY